VQDPIEPQTPGWLVQDPTTSGTREEPGTLTQDWCVCFYYYSTYTNLFACVGGETMDMCYERLRAEACVD
jgi:hypothetical protein